MLRKRIGGAKPQKRSKAKAPALKIPMGTRVVLVVLACVVGFAMVMAARDSTAPPAAKGNTASIPPAASVTTKAAPAPRKVATPPANRDRSPSAAGVAGGSKVIVEGCLVEADGGFRLKDTAGETPKARSWKTAFLKKRSASLTVTAGPGVALARHAGERVSLTGSLIEREMHATSLRRVAADCK